MVSGYVDGNPGQVEAAPPPPLEVQRPIPHNNRDVKKMCTTIFCRLLLLCYIIWSVLLLVMQPKIPKYKVESGNVQLNVQGYQLTGQWYMTLLGFNPNKYFNIYHKHIQAGILYQINWIDDERFTIYTLVKEPWPSFALKKMNHTQAKFKLSVPQRQLEFEEAQQIANESGMFQLRFLCSTWFVSKLLPPKYAKLQVACRVPHENGNITFTSQFSGKCIVVVAKSYFYEGLIICSFIAIVLWACCTYMSKPHKASDITTS